MCAFLISFFLLNNLLYWVLSWFLTIKKIFQNSMVQEANDIARWVNNCIGLKHPAEKSCANCMMLVLTANSFCCVVKSDIWMWKMKELFCFTRQNMVLRKCFTKTMFQFYDTLNTIHICICSDHILHISTYDIHGSDWNLIMYISLYTYCKRSAGISHSCTATSLGWSGHRQTQRSSWGEWWRPSTTASRRTPFCPSWTQCLHKCFPDLKIKNYVIVSTI